jgi:hypothetical protein
LKRESSELYSAHEKRSSAEKKNLSLLEQEVIINENGRNEHKKQKKDEPIQVIIHIYS